MTFKLLHRILIKHDIPENVKLMSDSGWECSATEMNGVYYNREENVLVFTQEGDESDYRYFEDNKWELLYRRDL